MVDPERFPYDPDRGIVSFLVGQWAHVALLGFFRARSDDPCGSDQFEGERGSFPEDVARLAASDTPFAVQFGRAGTEGEAWDLETFLQRWQLQLDVRYWQTNRPRRRDVDADRIRQLTTDARLVADGAAGIIGALHVGTLQRVADEVDAILAWPNLRFIDAPQDARGLADLYLSAHLWAFDQFNRALDGTREPLLRQAVQPTLDVMGAYMLKVTEADAWAMKVRRLEERIRPGQAENVMVDVLEAVVSSPPGDDGTSRIVPLRARRLTREAKIDAPL